MAEVSPASSFEPPVFKTPGAYAYRSLAAWLRLLIPAAVGLAADMAVKNYAFPEGVPTGEEERHMAGLWPAYLHPHDPHIVIPHVLGFTTTVNEGAVFGFAQGHVTLFLGFSVFALAIIAWVFATSHRRHWTVHLALGLIMAGALGNVYDRAVFHGVRDMLQLYSIPWYQYIFNVADALLCVGVPLLILRWLFVRDEDRNQQR